MEQGSGGVPVIRIPPGAVMLPDNDQWTNRFEVRSESSSRKYVIAQNKRHRHWGCACPGWRRHRKCHHLEQIGLPCFETPHEIQIEERRAA